jgi:hypothetical protein
MTEQNTTRGWGGGVKLKKLHAAVQSEGGFTRGNICYLAGMFLNTLLIRLIVVTVATDCHSNFSKSLESTITAVV